MIPALLFSGIGKMTLKQEIRARLLNNALNTGNIPSEVVLQFSKEYGLQKNTIYKYLEQLINEGLLLKTVQVSIIPTTEGMKLLSQESE